METIVAAIISAVASVIVALKPAVLKNENGCSLSC